MPDKYKERLSRWGVLYIWEPLINQELLQYEIRFDKLICVKKSLNLIYSGYFTVHHYSDDFKEVKFGQLIVQFNDQGKVIKKRVLTWPEEYGVLIRETPKQMFILDHRSKFPWFH